eukprot:1821211-Pyramimonas_sp.AAC.1
MPLPLRRLVALRAGGVLGGRAVAGAVQGAAQGARGGLRGTGGHPAGRVHRGPAGGGVPPLEVV